MKSLYIVFPEKEKVELREETIAPPKPGEVLCAAEKSLVSIGTETACLRGIFEPGTNWAEWVKYPFRPGYSMAARVIAVGQGVTGLKEGDRLATWIEHQQFFKIQPHQAHLVPEGLSNDEAPWAILACTTQLGVRRAELRLGETVGVIGLGLLGQLVTQYLAVAGARRVIAIDPLPSRLELAKAHGATHTLALDAASAKPEIEKITNGRMLDVVFDITGHPAVLAPAIQLLRRLGRVVLLGDSPTPSQLHLGPGVVSNSIAILGVHGTASPEQATDFSPWSAPEMAALFFDYLQQGRMRVADLITHRYSPLDAPQVYATLRQDRSTALGIIFDWSLL
jgi:2-desacetyl-2-hydroxyethyl bacteriochlorophyllide A dehydrogenase